MGLKIEKRVYGNDEKKFIEDIFFYWGTIGSGTIDTLKLIDHEKSHFRKAKLLGYSPEYRFKKIIFNLGFIKFELKIPHVRIEEKISPRDLKQICLAPENPSFLDKFYASETYQFFYTLKCNLGVER